MVLLSGLLGKNEVDAAPQVKLVSVQPSVRSFVKCMEVEVQCRRTEMELSTAGRSYKQYKSQ